MFGLYLLQRAAKSIGLYDVAGHAYLRLLARRHDTTFSVGMENGMEVASLRRGHNVLKAAAHPFAYCAHLVQFFDYYFDAVEPQQNGSDMVVDYSTPREHTLRNSGLSYYFSSLSEPSATTDIYLQYSKLKKGDVVFDLGAYCGVYVHAFSQAVGPEGRVFAFEPDAANYAALRRNIDRHQMNNVVPIQKGIWSSETTLEFHSEGNIGSSVSGLLPRAGQKVKVDVTSISAAVREYKIDRLDFIKMDIEGAEIEALTGAADVLARFSPKLVVEPHIRNGRPTTDAIRAILAKSGYVCEIIPQQGELDIPLIYSAPASR